MNWKTIKTFLIFLFLAVDIFLLAMTYGFYNSAKLSDQTIADTLTLLKKNSINVRESIIPRDAADTESIQLTNLYYSTIADNNAQIKLTDNGKISMTLPASDIPSNSTSVPGYISEKLSDIGFDTKNITITRGNGSYIMTYSVNKIPVLNSIMEVTVTDNSIKLVGSWYINEKQNTYNANTSSSVYATSALVEFISHPGRGSDPVTITNIDMGYYANTGSGTSDIKIVTASPCYRLTTDSNKVYYYSIPDSKFIN